MWLRRLQAWAPPLRTCESCRGQDEADAVAAETRQRILASGVCQRHVHLTLDRTAVPRPGESPEAFERRIRHDPGGYIGIHGRDIAPAGSTMAGAAVEVGSEASMGSRSVRFMVA
jgi:hypothetical protein